MPKKGSDWFWDHLPEITAYANGLNSSRSQQDRNDSFYGDGGDIFDDDIDEYRDEFDEYRDEFDDYDEYGEGDEEESGAEEDKEESGAEENTEEIKRSDFETDQLYEAARSLKYSYDHDDGSEYYRKLRERSQFILSRQDLPAARYLTPDGEFQFHKALQDRFQFPFHFPEKSGAMTLSFDELLLRIAKRDPALAMEAWEWALENFLPCFEYCEDPGSGDLTDYVINDISNFPENFFDLVVERFCKDHDFCRLVLEHTHGLYSGVGELVEATLRREDVNTAWLIFSEALKNCPDQEAMRNLAEITVYECKTYHHDRVMEQFHDLVFPVIRDLTDATLNGELDDLEREMQEYLEEMRPDPDEDREIPEEEPDEEPEDEDSGEDEESEEDDDDEDGDGETWTLRLDPQTERKLREEIRKELEEEMRLEYGGQGNIWMDERTLSDKNLYTYCAVRFPNAFQIYYYRTDDYIVEVGDKVIVPVGKEDEEQIGEVVAIGHYRACAVPYPLDRTKFILRRY